MMTTVKWLREKTVNLRCRLQKVATMKLLLEKIICSVDGEIIPEKWCEKMVVIVTYMLDQPVNKTAKLYYKTAITMCDK